MGAIGTGGVRVLNEEVVRALRIPNHVIDAVAAGEQAEPARRERLYRGARPLIDVRDRTVILVDDGLATGPPCTPPRHDRDVAGRAAGPGLRRCAAQRVRSNDRGPYSVRRRPRAPISTPLAWEEVDAKLDPDRYNRRTFDRRLADRDPWVDFWAKRQRPPGIRHTA